MTIKLKSNWLDPYIKKIISLHVIKSASTHVWMIWYDKKLTGFFFPKLQSSVLRNLVLTNKCPLPKEDYKGQHNQVLVGTTRTFNWPLSPKNNETFYIQTMYMLPIEFSFNCSLDPLSFSDSIFMLSPYHLFVVM